MAQIIATVIFIAMFAMIISEKIERHIVTMVAAAATIVFVHLLGLHSFEALMNTLNVRAFFELGFWYSHGGGEESSGINWATIVFILGMMIMVEGMAKAGFFRWLCLTLARLVKYEPFPIFIAFMVMAAVLSMFIDSITVILFLAAITIELAQVIYFDPVPFVIAEVFCANLGGSATMCGDPPNIIIGTSLGYTFGDFLYNTGLVAAISLVVMIVYFSLVFKNKISSNQWVIKHGSKEDLERISHDINEDDNFGEAHHEGHKIDNKRYFYESAGIFGLAIVLLVSHAQTGFSVALIGVVISIITLIVAKDEWKDIIKGIDYKTLLFLIGLFVVVGGLEETGVLTMIAQFIQSIAGDNLKLLVIILIWVSAICSAVIDNIPFAATMVPVISTLSATTGFDLSAMAWALAIGTDIGGSATPIGASANVVGISTLNNDGYKVGWGKYCKYAIPATVITLAISTGYIIIRYC